MLNNTAISFFLGVIFLTTPFFVTYAQYTDTVLSTDFDYEHTFSYNWDHTHLTSVSELRDSNLVLSGWSYIQFKQYDDDFNVINEKRYADSIHFLGGHRSLTYFQSGYYFPKNDFMFGSDTIAPSVVKFDTLGNVLWEKVLYSGYYKAAIHNIIEQQGFLYLYGWKKANVGDDTETYVSKMDTAGNILHTNLFSSLSEQSKLLSPCADGGFLMSNDFFNQPKYDTKIYKLDNNLNVQWTKVIDSSPKGTIVSAIEAPDGSVIFMGTSKHPLNNTERSYIGKLSANGVLLKDTVYDFSTGYDLFNLNGIVSFEENHLYIAGAIYEDLSADTSKSFLANLDYNLNLRWKRNYAKRLNENGIAFIHELGNGFKALAGYTFEDPSNSTTDEWFMVVDSMGCQNLTCVASLSVPEVNQINYHNINIYPNPASDIIKFNLDYPSSGNTEYTIFNTTGKIVLSGNTSSKEIDVSNLYDGFYLLSLQTQENYFKSYLIISR